MSDLKINCPEGTPGRVCVCVCVHKFRNDVRDTRHDWRICVKSDSDHRHKKLNEKKKKSFRDDIVQAEDK